MALIDWVVVAVSCLAVFAVGLYFARRASHGGLEGYFAGDRDLPWWAIGLSNTATYQSGNGAFVMLIVIHGLVGNWTWWASWIIWMPLAAILWSRLWQRAGVISIAELISVRYGGTQAQVARKVYATVCCFGTAVLVVAYITGFFAKTVAPLCPLSTWQILLIFGGCTVAYTMFGGLLGVVYTDVAQFVIMWIGCTLFFFMAVPQHGGWGEILSRIELVRPAALHATPPTPTIELLTVIILMIQGFFTVGDGTTAQRFIAARSEGHAVAGQLFNAFLSISFRTLPLVGIGLIAVSIFWTADKQANLGPAPAGMTMLADPAFAWAELIKRCSFPIGFVGLLVAAEVAAYMSTLSSLINWGSGLVVNDLLPAGIRTPRNTIWISRSATLLLFVLSALVTIFFVDDMMSWFMFINAAMGMFMLPLAVLRFCWWRFNAWGELSATILGLPLSIFVWFGMDFQHKPAWQGLMLLAGSGTALMVLVSLLTPPEQMETLRAFYKRCRPPGFWGPVREGSDAVADHKTSPGRLAIDAALGVIACLGLTLVTNAVFVFNWWQAGIGAAMAMIGGVLLIRRVL